VMPCGVADVVEVVVLAAGAHAFLRRYRGLVRALLEAGEDVLELHHAGIGEHQRGVVPRHQRGRRHRLVAAPGEEVDELRPDVVDAGHITLLPTRYEAKARSRLMFFRNYLTATRADVYKTSASKAIQSALDKCYS
jgi:hypothetical protein